MTAKQQAEYLELRGWKREGVFWRDKKTAYLWEKSEAVKQQQWRDRTGGTNGITQTTR